MEQRLIGRYQVLEEIASGGQATVYRAWDTRTGQVVALKVMHPHLAGDTAYLERFHREARLAASIKHRNVIRIFKVGSEENSHFIAMEYLSLSIYNLIEAQGQLPIDRAVDICHQTALALEAAQQRDIVHRDIKPHNILLAPDGTAKVSDFGIARGAELATMTRTGALMGTPHYMAPEQAQGQRVDIHSDLYSLGVVLYQMLTGEVPFDADTPWEVIRQHIEVQPQGARRLRSEVPKALEGIVKRCMEKDPARRYQSPRELAQDLKRAVPEGLRSRIQPESILSDQQSVVAPTPQGSSVQEAQPVAPPAPAAPLLVREKRRIYRLFYGAGIGAALATIVMGAFLIVFDVRFREVIAGNPTSSGTISGRITDAGTGLPVTNLEVEGAVEGYGDVSWTKTDSNGNYILTGLPDGVIEVYWHPQGYGYVGQSRTIGISEAGAVEGVDFNLTRGAAISGTDADGVTGHPIVESEISDGPVNGNHTAQDTTGTESCYDTRSDGDKLEILAIDPLPGTHLKAGENVDVTVQVLYRLDSHYRGNVELYYLLPPTNHDRYSGGSAGFTQFEVFEGSEIIVIQGTFEVPDIGETEISAHLQPPLDDLRAAGYDCWSSMARELAATYYIDGTGSAELVSASRLPRVPVEKVVRTPVETPVNFSVNRTIGPAILFSDSSWKVSDEEERGWNEVGFDDTSWINAQVLWEYWDYDDFPPAQPMWHPGRHEDDFKWYFFRNSFSIPSVTTIRLAEITIQVDDDYVLYINGVEIGRDESGTTEPSSIYDILPYLNSGENVTGVKAIDSHGGNEGVNLKLEVAREESDTQEVAAYPVQGSDFHVIAHIDGRSQLVIRGNSVQWLHLDNAAPGREDIVTFPTIINGTSWKPEWPDEPTGENHDCQCVSSSFKGLEPPLPKAEIHAGLEIIAARGVVFIVEMPTKENNYTLIVEFDDNRQEGPDWYEILIVVEPSFVQPTIAVAPTFGMTRGTTISGRVTDRKTGLPIANVEIKGEPFDEAGSYSDARTDADGRYTLRGIAPGIYLIKARALREGYIEVFYNDKINWDDADLVTISGVGAVEGIDFDLMPGASISGRIIDMDTGLPIASMDVHARLINGDRISSANTDGNGNYVLRGLPEGIIEIGANGHGYVEEHITVAISEAERIRGADLGLRLGTTISGRVVDAETGLPLANIHIRADNVFGKSGASEDTDADGRYILQAIAPGTYRIKAEGERKGYIRTFYDGKLGWGNADPVIVSGRSPIEGIDFGLQRGTSISGRVIDDETGLPISNVEISARPLGERNLSWDRTDSNGKYILKGLPVGVMEVQVNGQGYIKERISVVTREA